MTDPTTDGAPAAPELTVDEARDLADELGTELYRAQDALAFVEECCVIADREGRQVSTADVREWLKGARCGRQLLADAQEQTALRDRIAKALADARRPGLGGMTEADAVAYMADAVLGVLPASVGRAATARDTNRRLNYEKQRLEKELAAYRRAVAQWEISDAHAYVPLRTLAAIAKAAGVAVPEQWELHYERVKRAEADRAAVLREEAALIRAHCPDHLDADSAEGSWMDCHCPVADDMERRATDETPGAPTDADVVEAHRLALSFALGLGTGAPWDAIRDRAADLCKDEQPADEAQQPKEGTRP